MTHSSKTLPWRIVLFLALLAGLVGYAGNYHFMHGSTVSAQKLKKVSWSLSETFINVDEVGGLPMIVARARFPLFLQAIEAARE